MDAKMEECKRIHDEIRSRIKFPSLEIAKCILGVASKKDKIVAMPYTKKY